jgi:hypothetical protein
MTRTLEIGNHTMDAFEAVSSPGSSSFGLKRHFSPAEASRALTLVRRIVLDVVRDYTRLRELHLACQSCDSTVEAHEAQVARRRYASAADHLAELNEELEKVGCELRDYSLGLVDFPTFHEGRLACLCWKLGEERVAHWHEAGAACATRRPLVEVLV